MLHNFPYGTTYYSAHRHALKDLTEFKCRNTVKRISSMQNLLGGGHGGDGTEKC